KTLAMSKKSKHAISPTSIYLLADSLVKLSQSLASVKALKIPEGRCSLTLREYCEQRDLDCSSLKTLRDCSVMTTAALSKPLSPRLQNWGTLYNGKCLIANISAFRKIESAYTLSDIVQGEVHPRYFLSPEQIQRLIARIKRNRGQ